VNIPVGEVFTSPKLTGTNGVLHVSSVYLNGLEYKNLTISFKDGMIADYNCSNFDLEEENKIFEDQGLDAYSKYQLEHENDILKPGTGFPLIKALHNKIGIGRSLRYLCAQPYP